MFYYIQNKSKFINTFIYIYEVKALLHSSSRLQVRGFTPKGHKTKSKFTNENTRIFPNKKRIKSFIHNVQTLMDSYRYKLENSESLSSLQKKFSETKQNISDTKLNEFLSNSDIKRINDYGRNKVENFKEHYQISDKIAFVKARLFQIKMSLTTNDKQKEVQDCKQEQTVFKKGFQEKDLDDVNYSSDDTIHDERDLVHKLDRKDPDEYKDHRQMRDNSELAKHKIAFLSNNMKRLLSDIDRQMIKNEYYRNKLKISRSLLVIRQQLKERYRIRRENTLVSQARLAEEKVTLARDNLKEAQNRKRDIQIKLTVIKKDLAQIKTNKSRCANESSEYLDLVNKENDIIRDKKQMNALLKIANKETRELFNHFKSVSASTSTEVRSKAITYKYRTKILVLTTIIIGILLRLIS